MRKLNKKLVGAALAVILTMAMGMTALAAPSPSVNGAVNTVTSAVDKDGNAVKVVVREMPAEYKAEAAAIKDTAKVKEVLGSKFVEGMEVVDVQDVVVVDENGNVVDSKDVKFPLTITFKVPGVLSTTKVAVLHYTGSAWESVECKAGNGTITATFNSLSPVAFVVDKNTAASATDGTKSPKTGEGVAVPFAGAAAVVLLIGAGFCFRRREAR